MGGHRADGLVMDWKAVSQEAGPAAGLSSSKLGLSDGGWVIRELDVQISKSRLKRPTATGKAFRFRTLSPGDSSRSPPGSTTCVPRSPRSNAAARRGASPPRGGQLRGLSAGAMVEVVRSAAGEGSRHNSPRTSPMRSAHTRSVASTTLPKACAEQTTALQVSSGGTEFRRCYDGGLLPVHLIQKPDGSPARLIWTVDLQDVSLQKYLPLFVDGLREKEDPYRFVAFEGTTALLDCCGHQVLPVVPQLILPMKVALNSKDPQVVMTIMRVLQHLLLVGVPNEVLSEAQSALPPRSRSQSPYTRPRLDDGSSEFKSTRLQVPTKRVPYSAEVSCLAQACAEKAVADAEAKGDASGDTLQYGAPPALADNPWRWGVSQRTAELGAARLFPFYLMTPHALTTKSNQEEQGDSPRTLRHLASVSAALKEELVSLEKLSTGKVAAHRPHVSASLGSLPSALGGSLQDVSTPQRAVENQGKMTPKLRESHRPLSPGGLKQAKPAGRLSPRSRRTGDLLASSSSYPSWKGASSTSPRPSPASSPGMAYRGSPKASPASSPSPAHRATRVDSAMSTKKSGGKMSGNSDAAARLSALGDRLEKSLQFAERSVTEDLQLLDRRRSILRWAATLPTQSVLADHAK
mmetsp:Transcript_66523/g.124079  ORF Transcript_66523/g.124079 Transcript_66523/m.124079 type:complete len:634 (-) Transcript_66523:33-1934(-)